MKILVTGGGGFVGRALIPRLIEAGHAVVATSRNPATAIPGATVHPISELGPETDWSAALDGIEAVIHLAARVHVMNDSAADSLAENRRINTEGTRKLAVDAARAGIRRFIFLSTIKVNGEVSGAEPFRASDTPTPADPYSVTKLAAEQALSGRAAIIRPPLVYGPGVKGNFLSLLGLCGKGWPLPLGSINNRRSLIYVGNLAHLIVHMLGRPEIPNGVYLCRDGEDLSTPELFARVATALGVRSRIIMFPVLLLRLAASLTGKSAVLSRLEDSLYVDDNPTRDDLRWTPPFSVLQGLQETAEWFKS